MNESCLFSQGPEFEEEEDTYIEADGEGHVGEQCVEEARSTDGEEQETEEYDDEEDDDVVYLVRLFTFHICV